jgi:hypothetical protein
MPIQLAPPLACNSNNPVICMNRLCYEPIADNRTHIETLSGLPAAVAIYRGAKVYSERLSLRTLRTLCDFAVKAFSKNALDTLLEKPVVPPPRTIKKWRARQVK